MPCRALAALVATAAVCAPVLMAGPAALAADSPPGTIQVTGTQLKSALLPTSAFGPGGRFEEYDSGRTLMHPGEPGVARISCSLFSVLLGDSSLPGDPRFGFGATAEATEDALGSDRSYLQAVYQFSSARVAASLFAQAYAKYAKCRSFAFSGERIRLNSESEIWVGGHQAFKVTQTSYTAGFDAAPPYDTTTVFTIDGADAFILNTGAGSGASPASASPTALTLRLIARVRALR